MLKVVGASWLQTRISTYILVAVALLGIGAIILGEFGRVEDDGTYSATVMWKANEGYRIEFWGQGNDLSTLPRGAARAYYKTGILETGWSIIEIETNSDYPDEVQAFAAGLLEGSLTWQLIHHHWYNTVRAACAPRAALCRKMRRHLRENAVKAREDADRLESRDPYWHMVRLFYTQLDGIESGWRFAVQRSRQSATIDTEDFLWLAMASDLADLEVANNGTYNFAYSGGTIFLKILQRENLTPFIAFAQNTAAPYAKMLRLLKRYKFGYHVSPVSDAEQVPGRSIVMTSYPGALSSQDENYILYGEDHEIVLAGIPIFINNRTLWNYSNTKEHQVMSPARVMAANRLSTNSRTWSRFLGHQNSGTSNRQWVMYQPRVNSLWLVEQIPGITHAAEYSQIFNEASFFVCTGVPVFSEIRELANINGNALLREAHISKLQFNITTFEDVRQLMAANFMMSHEAESTASTNFNSSLEIVEVSEPNVRQILAFRGDLEPGMSKPFGVIDTVITLMNAEVGIETFEASSGPSTMKSENRGPFFWSKSFPNTSHIGHPDVFDFQSVTPFWVWI